VKNKGVIMQKKSNKRVIVLAVLAVLSAILYFVVANPYSPIANICEDTEYAKEQYANTNVKKKNKFIVERNNHCKVRLSEYKDAKSVYDKIAACTTLDNAMEASDKFIELKKAKHPKDVQENVDYYVGILDNFEYCPQYADVAKKLKALGGYQDK